MMDNGLGIFDQPTSEGQAEPLAPVEEQSSQDDRSLTEGHDQPINDQDVKPSEAETLPESDTKPKPRQFTSKIGDKEVKYTIEGDLDDLDDEELRLGYLRDRDYTRKRMQDAEKIKEVDAKRSEVDAMAQKLRSELIYEREQLESKEMQELKSYDEDEYYRRVHKYNDRINAFNDWQKLRNDEYQQHFQRSQQETYEQILTVIPDWVDEKKRHEEVNSMVAYLKDKGVNESDMGRFFNTVDLPIIRKAWLYDNLTEKSLKKNKDRTPPTSTTPSSSASKAKEKTLEEIFYGG